MDSFLEKLLETSFIMSLLSIILLIINRFLGDKYSSKYKYTIWLIIIIFLILPIKPEFNSPFNISLNEKISILFENSLLKYTNQQYILSDTIVNFKNIFSYNLLLLIWIIGALSFGCYYIFKNIHTYSVLHRWSTTNIPKSTLDIFNNVKSNLNITNSNIKLKVCKLNITPMIIGIKNPIILIPDQKIPDDELSIILKHELIHFKRHDIIKNLLGIFSIILHWFNPVVHIINYKMKIECEASCDEAVLHGLNIKERILYGEALIGIMERNPILYSFASTKFYGGKSGMKKRISRIMNQEKNNMISIPIILGIIIISLGLFSNSIIVNSKGTAYNHKINNVENSTQEIDSEMDYQINHHHNSNHH